MKNLKKAIFILITICIILVILLGIIYIYISKKDNDSQYYDPPVTEGLEEYEREMSKEVSLATSESDFFALERQIQKFFLYYKVKNKDALYGLLNKNYMQLNKISQENVVQKMEAIYTIKEGIFSLKEAYIRDSMERPIYYLKGTLKRNTKLSDTYIIINWDQNNITFSIRPITEREYRQYITEEVKEENNLIIEKNKYNKLEKLNLSDEEKAEKYFKSYIKNSLYDIEEAYFRLDKRYKEAKFSDLQGYKRYLLNKKEELTSMDIDSIKSLEDFNTEEEYNNYINNLQFKGLSKYSFQNTLDNKQCVCIDAYGNYYIFYITGAMQYTLILDTYTIDLPEFLEKYQVASDETKVQMNIQRFFDAINDGDYKYAYNKLDETYKANNFNTLEKFETYVKQNFFEKNKLSAKKVEKQDNTYLNEVTIKDQTGKDSKTITKTFVMQLKEGTDFVMSFKVN